MTDDQSYRLGIEVGRAAADMLKIEYVIAICLDLVDELDDDVRPAMVPSEFPPQADHGWFTDGYRDGLNIRCGEIVNRLNGDSAARLGAS